MNIQFCPDCGESCFKCVCGKGKTPEQKLRFIMELAGECWHRASYFSFSSKGKIRCERCKSMVDYSNKDRSVDPAYHSNPSPTDLNKLMELAEKLLVKKHYAVKIDFSPDADGNFLYHVRLINIHEHTIQESAETLAEALLNALFVAKGGLEDE